MQRILATGKSIVLLIALPVMLLTGCYYDKEELLYHQTAAPDCSAVNAKYSADIAPIIKNNCATSGCHNAAGSAGGIVLETYVQVSAAAVRINQRCIIEKTMPPSGPLSAADIASLTCWLNAGTPNN